MQGKPSDLEDSSSTKTLKEPPPGGVSVYTPSSDVLRICRKLKRNGLGFNHAILTERLPPPSPPPPPYPPLAKEQLNPPTPSVYVSTLSPLSLTCMENEQFLPKIYAGKVTSFRCAVYPSCI